MDYDITAAEEVKDKIWSGASLSSLKWSRAEYVQRFPGRNVGVGKAYR